MAADSAALTVLFFAIFSYKVVALLCETIVVNAAECAAAVFLATDFNISKLHHKHVHPFCQLEKITFWVSPSRLPEHLMANNVYVLVCIEVHPLVWPCGGYFVLRFYYYARYTHTQTCSKEIPECNCYYWHKWRSKIIIFDWSHNTDDKIF